MEDAPVKLSVAELVGKFRGHVLPMPTSPDKKNAFVDSHPPKVKIKNSLLIERLQANLALSPTSLLPVAKPAEVKQQPVPLSPISVCAASLQAPGRSPTRTSTRTSTLPSSQGSGEEEEAASFERPARSTPLPCLNKVRARVSFTRRPPTRQHRRSKCIGEDRGVSCSSPSQRDRHSPQENGGEEVCDSPARELRGAGRNPPLLDEAEEEEEEEVEEEDAARDGAQEDGSPTQNPATPSEGREVMDNTSPREREDSGESEEGETGAPERMEVNREDRRPCASCSPEPVGGSDHTELGSTQEADYAEN